MTLWVQAVAFMGARGNSPNPLNSLLASSGSSTIAGGGTSVCGIWVKYEPQYVKNLYYTIGFRGWDKCVWKGQLDKESASLTLSLLSPDGDQGFPGDLLVSVTYALGQGTLDLKSVTRISSQQSYFPFSKLCFCAG